MRLTDLLATGRNLTQEEERIIDRLREVASLFLQLFDDEGRMREIIMKERSKKEERLTNMASIASFY